MPSELWEIVRADELNVGDVAAFGSADETYRFVPSHVEIEADGVCVTVAETRDNIESEYAFFRDESVLRRRTGHHPDVLMRALKNLARTHVEDVCVYRDDDHEATEIADLVTTYIAEAEAEIAKERES